MFASLLHFLVRFIKFDGKATGGTNLKKLIYDV